MMSFSSYTCLYHPTSWGEIYCFTINWLWNSVKGFDYRKQCLFIASNRSSHFLNQYHGLRVIKKKKKTDEILGQVWGGTMFPHIFDTLKYLERSSKVLWYQFDILTHQGVFESMREKIKNVLSDSNAMNKIWLVLRMWYFQPFFRTQFVWVGIFADFVAIISVFLSKNAAIFKNKKLIKDRKHSLDTCI